MTASSSQGIVEVSLLSILRETLQAPDLQPTDDFFQAGGSVASAVAFMQQISAHFGVELPASLLMTHPTVAELATVVEKRQLHYAPASTVILRRGAGGANIFLLHDGEGDVLCYRPLAMRLPAEHAVFGIRAKSDGVNPILHTRFPDIVQFYAAQVRHASGGMPVVLGGSCIGGFIAFQVAKVLVANGVDVRLVMLFDSPYVGAPTRKFIHLKQEVRKHLLSDADPVEKALQLSRTFTRRLTQRGLLTARTIKKRTSVRALRFLVERGFPIPSRLHDVSVDTVLRFAERSYRCDTEYDSSHVVLFRAMGTGAEYNPTLPGDAPYSELYEGPLLGWNGRATHFTCLDVEGGHFSMLRSPQVRELAAHVTRLLIDAMDRRQQIKR